VSERCRILALDGGGLRGIFTAAVLVEAEDAFGPAFLDAFDLLVGTSTGGIIALGLASGRSCRRMLDFYRDAGPRIFAHPRRIRRIVRPKYDRGRLDDLLRNEFGETTRMNDLSKAVCITAHELVSGTTRVWKDDHAPGLRSGGDQLVWKVAAATSAAPTYLAPVQLGDADSHIDGGVWGNNPAMVGVTEAVRYFESEIAGIRLLSIGTTSQPLRVASHGQAVRMGIRQWISKALHLLQESSSMATDNQVRLLLGEAAYLAWTANEPARLSSTTPCSVVHSKSGATTWGAEISTPSVACLTSRSALRRSDRLESCDTVLALARRRERPRSRRQRDPRPLHANGIPRPRTRVHAHVTHLAHLRHDLRHTRPLHRPARLSILRLAMRFAKVCRTTQGAGFDGPCWARTSDLRLVEPALSLLS
jgi:uncharacterized protein